MHPPVGMPNGNVGTPTKIFMELIRQCRLPSSVIGKLGLEFPRSRAKRKYSSVPFDYGPKWKAKQHGGKTTTEDRPFVRTSRGHLITDKFIERKPIENEDELREEDISESGTDDDNDTCEEWERHESLHNDVTTQERSKERLFEEEIELKWEKGGSGLVFYTDAQYWDEQEGDFDEKTADDLDVDMSIYYEPGGGDKDAKDLHAMRREASLRSSTGSTSIFDDDFKRDTGKIGSFERYTKGFGRRVMEEQGWKDGQGLGKTIIGPAEAIIDVGQKPWDKKGFGFHGEKLIRTFTSQKRPRMGDEVRISTKYDDPKLNDPSTPLLRSDYPTRLKYKKDFLKGAVQ